MAEPEKPKSGRLTRIAAKASCAIFLVAVACITSAILCAPLSMLGFAGACLLVVGFLVGIIGLGGTFNARLRDIITAFTGTALNALLLCGMLSNALVRPGCAAGTSCIANLKQIEGAKATWALENHKTDSDLPGDNDLFGGNAYIRHKLACPDGGIYRIGPVGQKVLCSIPGHTL